MYVPWKISDFSGGLMEKIVDSMLPDSAARDTSNFIANKLGAIIKRGGQKRYNNNPVTPKIQALHPYYIRQSGYMYNDGVVQHEIEPTIRQLFVVADGKAYIWDGEEFILHGLELFDLLLGEEEHPVLSVPMFGESLLNHPLKLNVIKDTTILIEDTVNYIVGMDGVSRPWKYDGYTWTILENAPRRGYCPVMHHEKLFCIDRARSSTLRWSGSFQPEEWNPFDFWDISKDDGDHITCIKKFMNDLFVFKRRSTHILKGTMISDFSMIEIDRYVGCVGQLAAWPYQMKMYFVSDEGLCMCDGMQIINITKNLIPDIWDKINKDYLHRAVVREWKGRIWVALPKGDAQQNNMVLVYDPEFNAIFPLDDIKIKNMIVFNDGVHVNLYSIDDETGYVTVQDVGNDDYGEPINAYWKGKFFELGSYDVQKKARRVFMETSKETEHQPRLSICVDYKLDRDLEEDYSHLEYYREYGMAHEYKVELQVNRWNYLSPKIEHNDMGPCEIKGITVYYKPKENRNKRVGAK